MKHSVKQITFPYPEFKKPVTLSFDGPAHSSDGGLLLLRQVEEECGLCKQFAALLPDDRQPGKVKHPRKEQVIQRVFQIACGYEDCNDADTMRHDPLLKMSCGRSPEQEEGLSSQPTLSRFENNFSFKTLRKLSVFLEQSYVDSLPANTEFVILDIDGTDDETHGQQKLAFYHGYYRHYMYHPLLVYDGMTGQLITAVLRPGNAHAARGAAGVLRRVITMLKTRFPNIAIVVRGDSGFSVPRIHNLLDQLKEKFSNVEFLLGQPTNARLKVFAKSLVAQAKNQFETTGEKVRLFGEFEYEAKTWKRKRRVILKAEHISKGANPRFVVTSFSWGTPGWFYEAYCERGDAENKIKDLKNALDADRLSCSDFAANFFRLQLHSLTYRLMHQLRNWIGEEEQELGRCQFDTLRVKLLKVAVLVKESVRRILLQIPKAFPLSRIFRRLVEAGYAASGHT